MISRFLLGCALILAFQHRAWAIGPLTDEPLDGSDQNDDLDEVEELPTDSQPPSTVVSDVGTIAPQMLGLDELKLTQEELRSRFAYLVAAGIGNGKPWQGYTLEMGAILAKDRSFSLSVGGGSFKESGFLEERAYDVTGKSRSVAFALREYSRHFSQLALELVAGYADWSGRVDPHGIDSNDDLTEDAEALKLSSGFDAHGFVFGLGLGFSWLWDNGFWLDWTPLGIHASKLLQKDYDRDSRIVDRAVRLAIERPLFYGLMNFKLGYVF